VTGRPRLSLRACRCGTPVPSAAGGVCDPCDLRNTLFVLVLARYLRAHRRWGADFLIRMVDGHVDGEANARGWRMRGTEARP